MATVQEKKKNKISPPMKKAGRQNVVPPPRRRLFSTQDQNQRLFRNHSQFQAKCSCACHNCQTYAPKHSQTYKIRPFPDALGALPQFDTQKELRRVLGYVQCKLGQAGANTRARIRKQSPETAQKRRRTRFSTFSIVRHAKHIKTHSRLCTTKENSITTLHHGRQNAASTNKDEHQEQVRTDAQARNQYADKHQKTKPSSHYQATIKSLSNQLANHYQITINQLSINYQKQMKNQDTTMHNQFILVCNWMKKDRFQYIPVLVEIDEKYHEHLAWTSSKVS